MNSACIIAACAANARVRKKEAHVHIPVEELYYKVSLRKYYYFKPMAWSSPIRYNEYTNTFSMSTTEIEARTFAIASSFSVRASKCPNGIDEYIKSNLDTITATDEWKAQEEKVLADYVSEIKKWYNIVLDSEVLNYTTEYYWEVK
jgi:hypothetical protein